MYMLVMYSSMRLILLIKQGEINVVLITVEMNTERQRKQDDWAKQTGREKQR